MGSFMELEVTVKIDPDFFLLISGRTHRIILTALIRVFSKPISQFRSSVSSKVPGGGPPPFTTRQSMLPSSFRV